MSIDYDAACFTCRKFTHIGQYMGGSWSFGFGSNDEQGRARIGLWLMDHCSPIGEPGGSGQEAHDVRVVHTNLTPEDFTEDDREGQAR